jgi:hypothetical protein
MDRRPFASRFASRQTSAVVFLASSFPNADLTVIQSPISQRSVSIRPRSGAVT